MIRHFLINAFDQVAPRTCNRFRVERHLRKGLFVEPEVRIVPFLCERSEKAIDIGAADGCYAYVMSKYAKVVHAFEPNIAVYNQLKRRMPVNVEVHNKALSCRDGVAELRIPRRSSQLATIETANPLAMTNDVVDVLRVPIECLDAYGFDHVAFVKIDVEGHELAVVQGSTETLKRNQPALLVEIENRHSPHGIHRTVDYLQAYGYRCVFLDSNVIRSFDKFSADCDQNIAIARRKGRYINNFIFVFDLHLEKMSLSFDIDV